MGKKKEKELKNSRIFLLLTEFPPAVSANICIWTPLVIGLILGFIAMRTIPNVWIALGVTVAIQALAYYAKSKFVTWIKKELDNQIKIKLEIEKRRLKKLTDALAKNTKRAPKESKDLSWNVKKPESNVKSQKIAVRELKGYKVRVRINN